MSRSHSRFAVGGLSILSAIAVFLLATPALGQFPPDPDVNDDGVVNVLDVSLVTSCFSSNASTEDEDCTNADVNGDGTIDQADFDAVTAAFDQTGFPVCGDGEINRAGEICDGALALACGEAACLSSCLCESINIEITSPQSLLTVGASPITVSGTVDSPGAVLTLNGIPVTNDGGTFSGEVALAEGHNTIVARAVDASRQSTDSISVSLDLTPPYVTIDSHEEGDEVFTDRVTITGLINDIVRGTIEEDQATVTVNGIPAAIANRSYAAADVPLSVGTNLIVVVGTDQVGNTAVTSVNLVYEPPVGRRVEVVAGQGQTAEIGEVLPTPLAVQVLDDSLAPVENAAVIFRVTQGSGAVAAGLAEEARAVVVQTDATGAATTPFRLGTRSGTANHKVRAQVVGYDTTAVFTASATGRIGNKVNINSGNNQRGAVGQVLPQPLVVSVTDDGANVVAGARVRFDVTRGGGTLPGGASTYEATTDSDGRATAELTLGPLAGLDAQRVKATLIDAPPGDPITAGFLATAFVPADPGDTRITGVVLDNQDDPIPGVTIRIEGSPREGVSDEAGIFEITEAPVGPVHLIADGSTTTLPGEFPSLSYNLVTVAGVENPLPAPIYMVKLDTENAVFAGPDDVVLELDEYPGFKLEIAAGSVTFPDGSSEGLVSVTPVNSDKVPMPPPNGMQPQLIVTIQPTNTMFDPPARLSLPNLDGFAPGTQAEMYSFDHDLEEFVSIGLGTVSEDGSVVRSNPGVGVVKAGWHCGSQPGGQGCANGCPVCKECDGDCNCQPTSSDPRVADQDQSGDCKKPECQNGSVKQVPDDGDEPEDNPCMMCSGGDLNPVADGTMPSENKCQVCMDGSLEEVDVGDAEVETGISVDLPPILESTIETGLKKIPSLDAEIAVSVQPGTNTFRNCCDPEEGIIPAGEYERTAGATLTGNLTATLYPPPPASELASFDIDKTLIDAFGVEIDLEIEGRAGVFLDASITFQGNAGARLSACDEGSPACGFGRLEASTVLELLAEISATACIEIEVGSNETENCAPELVLKPIGLSVGIVGNVGYNEQSCSDGLTGDVSIGVVTLNIEVTLPGFGSFIGYSLVVYSGA